jgi:hypothetical protein
LHALRHAVAKVSLFAYILSAHSAGPLLIKRLNFLPIWSQ